MVVSVAAYSIIGINVLSSAPIREKMIICFQKDNNLVERA